MIIYNVISLPRCCHFSTAMNICDRNSQQPSAEKMSGDYPDLVSSSMSEQSTKIDILLSMRVNRKSICIHPVCDTIHRRLELVPHPTLSNSTEYSFIDFSFDNDYLESCALFYLQQLQMLILTEPKRRMSLVVYIS